MAGKYINPSVTEGAIEDTFNALQQLGIRIPHPAEVRDYLLHHPDLVDRLLSIHRIARASFGSPTRLSLEIYRDPEIEDKYLTLYVRQAHYNQTVMDEIEKISTDYQSLLEGIDGWLVLTTDFRQPE